MTMSLLLLAAQAVKVVSVTKHWVLVDTYEVVVDTKKNLPDLLLLQTMK